MLQVEKRKIAKISQVRREGNRLVCETEHGLLWIEPVKEDIIRVRYTLKDHFVERESLGVIKTTNRYSHWKYVETEHSIELTTDSLILHIAKVNAALTYLSKEREVLMQEPVEGGKELIPFESYRTVLDEESTIEQIQTPDGIKSVIKDAKKVLDREMYHSRVRFQWSGDEAIYGFGQQEEGALNLRGTRQYIHQANMKIAMPFLLSTKGYGILFETYSTLMFNDNEYGSYVYSEAVDALDYYFVQGETFDQIIRGYRYLTGMATMMPKWAFGFMQSQERFESQEEITHVVNEYRRRNIPLDCMVLDWMSWEDGHWGQKSFDANRFPDVPKMTDWLHEHGVHFMISIWPNMNSCTANYAQMKTAGNLFQQSEIYNVFDPEAREMYWQQANDGLFSKGVDAWWCDSCEPVTPEWNQSIKPEPDQNCTAFHSTAKVYMDEAYTNAYPLLHARTMYEGQRKVTEEKRVVNLTRSAYTGQQRYGTILWSGDTAAKWQTLQHQIPAGLSLCASGLPYWTLDIGAFFVKKGHMWFWDGEFEAGNNDLGYLELYTRWFQFGAFLPVFRAHGTDVRREVWETEGKELPFYEILKEFIELRYRLLPYIYSLGAAVTFKDVTMMRLLAFDFKHDPKVYNIKDQYMFGDAFMVCPVTTPMYYETESKPLSDVKKSRLVYLPEGTTWYDFWTNTSYIGGQTIEADAPLEKMPLFLQAGSIIPMCEVALSSDFSSEEKISLMIYTGKDGQFSLYQDEKDNYNYEQGAYSIIDIRWDDASSTLTLSDRIGTYKGMPERIEFKVELNDGRKEKVNYEGKSMMLGF